MDCASRRVDDMRGAARSPRDSAADAAAASRYSVPPPCLNSRYSSSSTLLPTDLADAPTELPAEGDLSWSPLPGLAPGEADAHCQVFSVPKDVELDTKLAIRHSAADQPVQAGTRPGNTTCSKPVFKASAYHEAKDSQYL